MSLFPITSPFSSPETFQKIITDLSLTSGLQMVFDAGDANCYAGSGETLFDTNGSDDAWFGADGSTSGDEPTFNGTPGGVSSSEFFSFDGGDFFQFKSQPTVMNAAHQNNAVWTFIMVHDVVDTASSKVILGTDGGNGSAQGFVLNMGETETLNLNVGTGSTTALNTASIAQMPTGSFTFGAWSLDESVGANGLLFDVNGTQEETTSTYFSPGAGWAVATANLMGRGNGNYPIPSGFKMACFAAWNIKLTGASITDIRTAIMARFAGN